MAEFTYGGETFQLVDERYTLGEIDALERHVGLKFSEFSNPENAAVVASTRAITAMMWVSAKRVNPALTFEEVSNWVLDDVEFGDSADPTRPRPGESVSDTTSTKSTSPKGGTGPRKKSKG